MYCETSNSKQHKSFDHLLDFDMMCAVQLCDQEQLADVVEHSLGCGPNFKYHYKNGKYVGAPHQYNCTYLSALGGREQDYLLVMS